MRIVDYDSIDSPYYWMEKNHEENIRLEEIERRLKNE